MTPVKITWKQTTKIMNQEQKAQKYDWLLNQYKMIELEIKRIPKLPLEETLQRHT